MNIAMVMAAIGAAAAIANGAPGQDEVGARIQASYDSAQSLQGPLDGSWILREEGTRRRFALEFTDPPGFGRVIEGAWNEAPLAGSMRTSGAAEAMRLGQSAVQVTLRGDLQPVRVTLRRPGDRGDDTIWKGWVADGGRRRAVAMVRPSLCAAVETHP